MSVRVKVWSCEMISFNIIIRMAVGRMPDATNISSSCLIMNKVNLLLSVDDSIHVSYDSFMYTFVIVLR